MYRYYKSYIDDEYVVMFDNPLIGAVEDSRYINECDAINRVDRMNTIIKKRTNYEFSKKNQTRVDR